MNKFKIGDKVIYTAVLSDSQNNLRGKVGTIEDFSNNYDYRVVIPGFEHSLLSCREGNLKLASQRIFLFEDDE
jgi:hypothetical protein